MYVKEDDGRWSVAIDAGDGSPVSKYYGATQEDVLSELVKAQSHATRTIREQKRVLKSTVKPDRAPAPIEFKPRQLTNDERYILTQRLNDPSQSAEALRDLLEAELGASMDTVRNTLTVSQETRLKSQYANEAQRFIAAHPDYKPTTANEKTILDYLTARDMDYTANNLALAFEDLKDTLDQALPIPATVATVNGRARFATTGIPARSNVNVQPANRVVLTAEEINRMGPEEYRAKLSDPKFRDAVNKLYATPRP